MQVSRKRRVHNASKCTRLEEEVIGKCGDSVVGTTFVPDIISMPKRRKNNVYSHFLLPSPRIFSFVWWLLPPAPESGRVSWNGTRLEKSVQLSTFKR